MKAVLNWLWQTIQIRAKRSWQNSLKIHNKALTKSEGQLRLAIALILVALFSYALIPDNTKLGISFLFAGLMAIYAGYIYKGREVIGLVLVGVALASTLIPSFFPGIKESLNQGDYVGMIVLILFGVFFWYFSGQLKKGEVPEFGERKPRKRTKRKRK